MKYLLTGGTGMLGSAFAKELGASVVLIDRAALDVRSPRAIRSLIEAHRPDALINCAAHVDAEAAEHDPDPAFATNAILPGLLAVACRHSGALMVHFSSTGCYGDWKTSPYTEEDPVRPTTVHHRSKVSGEDAVRASGAEHLILRTGWLFGGDATHKKNFVWKRLCEAAATDRLKSDAHQHGNPTFVEDVVDQTLMVVADEVRGTFNCVGRGSASRLDYVAEIVRLSGLPCDIEASGPFRRAAPVSPNETAVNYRLGLMGLDAMPHWTESLGRYMARVLAWSEWGRLTGAEV